LTPFEPIFVPDPLREAVSDEAWLAALLEAERALAHVTGDEEAAEACRPELYDIGRLCEEGRVDGNPVVPLARALRQHAPGAHRGATSQDILDTAAMLVARNARGLVLGELDGVAAACAGLAEAHRSTPTAARTLLQQAVPTTFGLKAAGWLVAVVEARRRLAAVRLPAQLGGPAGTLDPELTARFAAELGLAEPALPWHVHRGPVAELAAGLDAASAACAKIGLDVVLLAQTEVGEVAEGEGGGSSSMPHKRNPAAAVLARACARIVHANAGLLTGGDYEHERAAGAWQAEWPALSAALAFAGGAAAAARRSLEGLRVDPGRMASNMTEALSSEQGVGSAEALVDRALELYRRQAP
jgi:3-carboxy-cis,cis-muconate cycloisomerase